MKFDFKFRFRVIKSRITESYVVKPILLRVALFCNLILLEVNNMPSLLKVMKSYREFFSLLAVFLRVE